jgi:hypothetical protein
MNNTEYQLMMEYLQNKYHTFFDLGNPRTEELIKSWWQFLKHNDTEIMWDVLYEYTASSQYAPQLVNIENAYNQKVETIEKAVNETANLIRAYIDDATGVNETERERYYNILSEKLYSIPLKKREAATETIYMKCRQSYSELMQDISILNDIMGEIQ